MRNLKLTLAYDGTRYHGFQDQGDDAVPTVQRCLERAWERLVGESVRVNGAGRTDAGVHALGQVVNLRTETEAVPVERVPYAFNSVLPDDVRVMKCESVHPDFHARYDAQSKTYVYRIVNQEFPSPLARLYTHFVRRPLDIRAMAEGARFLVGTHDFAAFAGTKSAVRSTERTLFKCEVNRQDEVVAFTVQADGFLYHMVRAIVGTLLEVGRGDETAVWVKAVLASRNRARAGATLPGNGLILHSVSYRAESYHNTGEGEAGPESSDPVERF